MHLQVNPGADIPLLNIVLKTILERHEEEPDAGWIDDEAFIDERTEGFDHLKETLEDFDKEAAAEEAGVPSKTSNSPPRSTRWRTTPPSSPGWG